MSKRYWLVVTKGLRLAALTGACAVLVAGCGKKKTEAGAATGAAGSAEPASATPGVTATEIKIGTTMPLSGPASAYAVIGKTDVAYFRMINDKGGINGRKVTLVMVDDGYSPPKTVQQTRKLVEDDGVAFLFNGLGTAANSAIQSYLNDKHIPQLFVATGAEKWANPTQFPWTIGWQPSYRAEAKLYAQYVLKDKPAAKVCVLFQNDDFGKDYLAGLHTGFADQYDKLVIKTASYEVTDPTVDSQIVTLQGAGCDTLVTAATPKFAAQTIRKVFDLGWKPLHLLSNVSVSITAVLKPAGLEKSTGIVSAGYLKDPSDPANANDPGMNEYRAFMKQYLPDLDPSDANTVYGYGVSMTLAKVLTQCGNDLSRDNIMKQATSLSKLVLPVTTPGLEINTSPTRFRPIAQVQLVRFNGTSFEAIGSIQDLD